MVDKFTGISVLIDDYENGESYEIDIHRGENQYHYSVSGLELYGLRIITEGTFFSTVSLSTLDIVKAALRSVED